MAELFCGAVKCTYNKDNYCCKGDIMVGASMLKTVKTLVVKAFMREGARLIQALYRIPARQLVLIVKQ